MSRKHVAKRIGMGVGDRVNKGKIFFFEVKDSVKKMKPVFKYKMIKNSMGSENENI